MKKAWLYMTLIILTGAGCSRNAATNNVPQVPVIRMQQGVNTTSSETVGMPGPGAATPRVFGDTAITLVSESKKIEPIQIQATLPYTLHMSNTEEEWRNPSTTVSVHIPVMTHANSSEIAEAFNKAIREKAEKIVKDFMGQVAEWEGAPIPSSEVTNFIDVSVNARTANAKVLSLVFEVNTYFAGAAHPNTNTFSLNFDLEQKKELALKDLFVASKNYISKLSAMAIAEIKSQNLDPDGESEREWNDDWLKEGAGPNEINFHTVTIAPEGMYIEFDPYDIDSYAAGSTEILIPYAQLSGYVSPRVLTLVK